MPCCTLCVPWKSPISCVSTALSFDVNFAHNMWNSLQELLFHVQVGGIFEPFVVETDLAKIAVSCYALDLLRDKEEAHAST